jgi:colicin import membrane protein
MTRLSSSSPDPPQGPPEDPFRYGWRYVKRVLPDGQEEWDQVPLTLEDVLHPEEEDVIPVRSLHEIQCHYLTSIFRARPQGDPIVRVTADLRIDWGVEGIRPHSPDLAIFWGLREKPNLHAGTFNLAGSGGQCVLVLEIISPDQRVNDVVHKFDHYYRIGLPLYVIIDQEMEADPQTLRGYRWTPQGYESIPLDERGRLYLGPINLFLRMHGEKLIGQDAETGRELGDYTAIIRRLDEANRKLKENEALMEELLETNRKETQAREAALRQAREDAQAKEVALRLAREETQAREVALSLAFEEAQSRETTERKIQKEVAARQEAEEQLRQLQAVLRQMQEQQPPQSG